MHFQLLCLAHHIGLVVEERGKKKEKKARFMSTREAAKEEKKNNDAKAHLDFHSVEHLAVVNTDNRADHLWENDHVAEVSVDSFGLVVDTSVLLLHSANDDNRTFS